MITFRRHLLDRALTRSIPLMKGKVLDIGGKKINKRGSFNPPFKKVESWYYLNPDFSTKPDYCCLAETIPFKDNSIDTIIMTEVIQYLPEPQKVLREIYRVLTCGGFCIVSSPYLVPIHGDYWADRYRFTALKLKEMFEEAGFQRIKIEPMGSLGAVLSDTLHVTLTYAQEGQKYLLSRVLRIIFRLSVTFFIWLDHLTETQQKYITIGYFLTAEKKG